ncbi:MAG: serine/threonine protein kinase [Planctomycetia bacterium]|nr:serine/threonine protein kinase [Planctomycetia bacterium]
MSITSGSSYSTRLHAPTRVVVEPTLQSFGAWQTGHLLHDGPLASVYEARPAAAPAQTPFRYVLKRLHPQWEQEPRAMALVAREALVGREVSHPHLVSVLDAQLIGPPCFVVMPRLVGRPLSVSVGRGRRLRMPQALWFARQVAEALEALHQHRWLHADVKPANMLLSRSGHVTLIDLGFARHFDEAGTATDRWIAGTFDYIAPETIVSASRFDGRSDIYSLGATLYEMLAGRPPFIGKDLADLAAQHRQATPPALDSLVPDLPRDVIQLVHQMLAKEPLRRPHDAQEVVRRLVALEVATLPDQVGRLEA